MDIVSENNFDYYLEKSAFDDFQKPMPWEEDYDDANDLFLTALIIEDNSIKEGKIERVMKKIGSFEIDLARTLEDAIEKIGNMKESGLPYDVIISDMWYPMYPGSSDNQSGMDFIKWMHDQKDKTPIIICSSIKYQIPEIYGAIQYKEESNWEMELIKLLKNLDTWE